MSDRQAAIRQRVLDEVAAEMNRTDENLDETPTEGDYLADVERRLHTLVWHANGEEGCVECRPSGPDCQVQKVAPTSS